MVCQLSPNVYTVSINSMQAEGRTLYIWLFSHNNAMSLSSIAVYPHSSV